MPVKLTSVDGVMFTALCLANNLPEPVPEFQFALPRKFAFDWCFPSYMLALEKEGGIYGRGKPCPVCKRRSVGAHTSIERLKSDQVKYNLAAIRGWCVLRARPEQFDTGEVFELIHQALRAAQMRHELG